MIVGVAKMTGVEYGSEGRSGGHVEWSEGVMGVGGCQVARGGGRARRVCGSKVFGY